MQTNYLKSFGFVFAICALHLQALGQSLQPQKAPSPVVPITPIPTTPAPVIEPAAQPPRPNPADLPANVIAWDALDKAVSVTSGEPMAKFTFALTNVSAEPVTIVSVHTSCGCTTAQIPALPWTLEPASNGVINVNMNLLGKIGTVIKAITVSSDKGTKHLLVRTTISPLQSSTTMAPGTRERNMMLARVDRQAVFKGDCASCHAVPAKGKMGKELYASACGVCHEAEHRASMVPNLHVAKQEQNGEFWRNWITNGKQGTLMPAFAIPAHGILSEAQINSLVGYLMKTMPTKPTPVPTRTAMH